MAKLDDHPTVIRHRQTLAERPPKVLDAAWLRRLCLDAGADDVGFVAIDRPELDDQRAEILGLYPWTKGLISIVCRMNREPIRSPARSVANLEFHHTGDRTNEVARAIVAALEAEGRPGGQPVDGLPDGDGPLPRQDLGRLAQAGRRGGGPGPDGHPPQRHPPEVRQLHPPGHGPDRRRGRRSSRGRIDYNPCLECKLCVAACPVGAIAPDGHFDFSACYTHNYREFMGGFGDWVEQVADSKDALDYRRRVERLGDGLDVAEPRLRPELQGGLLHGGLPGGRRRDRPVPGRPQGLPQRRCVNPLQEKQETVYVVPGSDAEAYAAKRFPHKTDPGGSAAGGGPGRSGRSWSPCRTSSSGTLGGAGRRPTTSRSPGRSPPRRRSSIRDKTIRVEEGHVGAADLHVRADSRTWLGVLRKEKSLLWALIRRKIVFLKGSPRLLMKFGKCFPS